MLTYFAGNPLGPMLEIDSATRELANLNKLIRAPWGCGEQNMIRVAPSVYVYTYKQSVGQWSPKQQQQAINLINEGKRLIVVFRVRKLDFLWTWILAATLCFYVYRSDNFK